MAEPTDREPPAVDRLTDPSDAASWERERERDEWDSRPRVSLGPLSMLGFGPQLAPEPSRAIPPMLGNLLGTAAVVIIIAALKEARPVLVPLVVSIFAATLTAPIVLWLQKRRIPPAVGVPVVVVLTLTAVALVAGLVVGSLNAFIQAAPRYEKGLDALIVSTSAHLEHFGIRIDASKLLNIIQTDSAIGLAAQLVSQLADLFSSTILILLLTVLVLFEALVLPDKIRKALRDPSADLSQGMSVVGRVQAYVVLKTYTSLTTGVIIGGLLFLQGIDFALLWGLLAFLLDFLPSIGALVATTPAMLLALVQQGVSGALITAGIFFMVNLIVGNFVEPRVMGRRMNLSPLIVFMSLIFWGWLWGPLGMILSVPLTMILRILLEGNPATRPFAILMAGQEERPVIDLAAISSLPLSRRSRPPRSSTPPRGPSIPPPPSR